MTIIGGYLGSGKTLRVNELLAQWAGAPIAVLVNDFGAVNVDVSLIRSQESGVLELENGCVCCSLADGMAEVMRSVAAMVPRPGHLLIEASGVGDPAAIAKWARLPGFALNGIVVCVDVETVQRRARDKYVGDTVLTQLRSADLIVVTKTDLVAEAECRRATQWLRQQAPGVPLIKDRQALALILSDGRPDTARLELAAASNADRTPALHDSSEPAHRHTDAHVTWAASVPHPVDLDRLERCLRSLPEHVVRGKGVVRTTQSPQQRTVIQLVGKRLEFQSDGEWSPADGPSSMVLIATSDPDGVSLQSALEEALSPTGTARTQE